MGRDFKRSRLAAPAFLSYIIEFSIGFPVELVSRSPANSSPVAVRMQMEPVE
jgi:hypothetical protein